jgi:ADP-ribosylglycohydrolase
METKDRFRGCLLGLAVGDAVGTTLEFKPPGSFKPITGMIGGGPFRLKPGEWTDDTSMALCLATSLIEKNCFDPKDQMDRYYRWWKEGYLSSNGRCFDIGQTVVQALQRYQKTGDPIAGSTSPHSAGNGCIMRLAPVPMFYSNDPEEAIQKSAESSRTTHGAAACLDACRYFAALLFGALCGCSKEDILSARYTPVPGYWDRRPLVCEIDEIACGSVKRNFIDFGPAKLLPHTGLDSGLI